MSAQIKVFPESAQGGTFNGLEKVLEKSGIWSMLSSDFSVRTSNRLIDDAINTIEKVWSMYHQEELNKQGTRYPPERIDTTEIIGNRGFYAKVKYVPPDQTKKRNAQIKVEIPLREDVDGLNSLESTELREIAKSLRSKGYR